MGRVALAYAAALLALAAAAAPAAAHERGKAQARISASLVVRPGLEAELLVNLTDVDSGKPIRGAEVTVYAQMTRPHVMRTARVRVPEDAPGTYTGRLQLPMPAAWTFHIAAGGPDVVGATAKLERRVRLGAAGAETSPATPAVDVLPTRIEDDLTQGDAMRMASLWLHVLAAGGWIIGVLVMAIALSTRPGVLAETARARLARGYAAWGAWLHWSLVLVVVATGVYQMLYVAPFPLAYTPDDLARLAEIPYGLLYEAILIAKLALFGILVITGTATLLRLVDPPLPAVPVTNPHPGFVRILASALGPAGVVYLLTVPLILAAAMALRYVHVLAHVAEVVQSG